MFEEAEALAIASQRLGTRLLGKYHLDSVLGVGGMATVYAATHRNRKRFAVKMLHTEFSVRSEVRTRFVREGYLANSVPHPGVVAVLDDDLDETGAAFLVMELLEGVTVEALYLAGAVPVREALAITCQVLDVLDVAHENSVVHRDIKPANLFVLRDGRLKVLDFGIARLRDVDSGLKSTRSGALLGTPAFMAPEQALAMPEHVDARTDVWAVGATLFTMLSARFVRSGENARQIMIRAATEPARSLDSIMPELPSSVVALVARALAFERSERWQSAAAMRDAALEANRDLFGSEPVRADVARLVERTSAVIATQPTQPDPLVDPRAPAIEPRTAAAASPHARALQTTASTPVSAIRPAPTRSARWAVLGLVAAAVLGLGILVAGRKAEVKASSSARLAVSKPPAIEALASAALATSASASPPPGAAPSALAPASGNMVGEATPPRATAVTLATSAPRGTRPLASTTKPAASASMGPSRSTSNPLQLELQ